MITLSEIVVVGLLEAFAVLVLAVVFLLFFNHRLHKRGATLHTQLHQLKDTTKFLLNKVNAFTESSYAHFLGEAVDSAKSDAEDVFKGSDLSLEINSSNEQRAAKIRYLLLDAELASELEPDKDESRVARSQKLSNIISDLEQSLGNAPPPEVGQKVEQEVEKDTETSSIDEADLKQKWGYLCDAAVSLVAQRTLQSEEDLVDILRAINKDLNLDDIVLPSNNHSDNHQVTTIKKESDHNRDIISKLLSERKAAEDEVNIKATELERLERFLKESEWCIRQLEQELLAAQDQKTSDTSDTDETEITDMKNLIQRFTQESSEMLMCIETLEQENSSLKKQLGLN